MDNWPAHQQAAKQHPSTQTLIAATAYGMGRGIMEQGFWKHQCVIESYDDRMDIVHLPSGERWNVNKLNLITTNPKASLDILFRNARTCNEAWQLQWSKVPQEWWEALGE